MADLLRKGFDVFSAVGGNPPFDLVAHKDGHLLRVEVKGKAKAPRSNMPIVTTDSGNNDCRLFDIFATVHHNDVRYSRSILHMLNVASKQLVGEETIHPKVRKDLIAKRAVMEGKC